MKKLLFLLLLAGGSCVALSQSQEIEQLKLDLEKLAQMKRMLQSMYDGYNTLSKGYNQVILKTKDNFDLHKNYLDQLLQVAPAIRNYPVIQSIIGNQTTLVSESIAAYGNYLKSGLFSVAELGSIKGSFDRIQSVISKKISQLNLVLTPGTLRMSDQERIRSIDRIDKDVGDALATVRALVKEQDAIAAVRGQQKRDNNAMRAWYGFKQ
ncbi:MAG: hypothetical protein KGO92_15105 [Bacteroidota bacterium]|nr:hypothetical protein [Bacteroidota bacterium]